MSEVELLDRTDALLRRVGQHGFKDIEELQRLACSMFVYLYESIFERLEGIERRPGYMPEYAYNADLVIQAFEHNVGVDLSDISGEEIAQGNLDHIDKLLTEFEDYLILQDEAQDEFEANEEGENNEDEEEFRSTSEQHLSDWGDDDGLDALYSDAGSDESFDDDLEFTLKTKPISRARGLSAASSLGSFPTDRRRSSSKSQLQPSLLRKAAALDRNFHRENVLPSTLRRGVSHEESSVQESEEDLANSDDLFDTLMDRFSSENIRLRKRFDALKSLARHRYGTNSFDKTLRTEKERDKGRFRRAYNALVEEERRQDRIRAEKSRLLTKLEEQRRRHEAKVERIKMEKLAEQLAREQESRRLRRKNQEDAIVRKMFEEALAAEKERVIRLSKLQAEDRLKQDQELLKKYEATRKVYEDQKDMLEEAAHRKEEQEKTKERIRKAELRRMAQELKKDFEAKLQRTRSLLDAREDRTFFVNAETIERAFSILSDTRAAMHQAQVSALA